MSRRSQPQPLELSSDRVAAFFDLDGTITWLDSFLIMGICGRFSGPGRVPLTKFLKALLAHGRGTISNSQLKEALLVYFKGFTRSEMEAFCSQIFNRVLRHTIYPEVKTMLDQHNDAGHVTVLVSASLEEQVLPAARYFNVEEILSSRAEYKEGWLTGRLDGEACHGDKKVALVRAFCQQMGIEPALSYAYGDSMSDLSVLELCGHACVVNGGRRLRSIAAERGWQVLTCRAPLGSLARGLLFQRK